MNRKTVFIAGIFIILLLTGKSTSPPVYAFINNDNKMIEKDSVIPAKTLYDSFKKDETAATEKYGGKTMTVKGFVVYTGPDVYALPSIELSEKKDGESRILCVLPFSDYLKLRKVKKGEEVTISGQVRGFYEKGDQVLLKQCVIKE